MKRVVLIVIAAILLIGSAAADEGMWLFNHFPTDKIKAKYGWAPDQAWLDHVRLSSVRFNNGGSGSFVSADGLAFTNHHVGATCLQQISTPDKNYYQLSFLAKTRAEEVPCKDLELNVLESIDDVTNEVQGAIKPGMTDAQAGTATRAEMSSIENDCTQKTGLRCDVVPFYSGGMYNLYRYKKYTDVRLVFAPEFAAAFFGGDPDNFEYPRYDLDITFFRVYENGQPVHLKDYLKWSAAGVGANDLVFVSGNPGSTGRLLTTSQIDFRRDVQYPWALKNYKQRVAELQSFSAKSEKNAAEAQEDVFGYQNSVKAYAGYQSGLLDKALMDEKRQSEAKLKQALASDPAKQKEFGNPWSDIDAAMQTYRKIFLPLAYIERLSGWGEMANNARELVRLAAERPKPNGERLREYRESAIASLQQSLLSTAPVHKDLNILLLSEALREMRDEVGAADPTVQKILNGKSPEQRAQELIDGSRLDQPDVRKELFEGGEKAVEASTDPLIVLMREIDARARELRKAYDDEVDSIERASGSKLAKLRFATEGMNQPPDATFTLRLSYGKVEGYVEDGRGSVAPKGAKVSYFTTFAGAFDHAAKHGDKDPYKLPESWTENKSKIKLDTPLNFVATPDIIGGNSGSPVVNNKAEVVGIIFDGNIQMLPGNFQYSDTVSRAVSVDERGIIEALRNIYHATALADELQGRAATPGAPSLNVVVH
ncbi:MAG: S46 family peptidase [Terriglobales bacterium]